MSKVIHEYQIKARSHIQLLETPADWEPLSVQPRGHCVVICARVDTDEPMVDQRVCVVTTGQELPEDMAAEKYLGTVYPGDDGILYHVFTTTGRGV